MDDLPCYLFCETIVKMGSQANNIELASSRAASGATSGADSQQNRIINELGGSIDQISLFQVAYRSVTNFALEHVPCSQLGKPSGTDDTGMTFTMSKRGDLCTSVWLETRCPPLEAAVSPVDPMSGMGASTAQSLVSYVWGLGYAMVQHCQFCISHAVQEEFSGDWMEISEELHSPAGRRLEECVLKLDRVTLPEMAAISTNLQGVTLFTPIPYWFTKGTHAALPLVTMNCQDIEIKIHLRKIEDIVVGFDKTMASPVVINDQRSGAKLNWDQFAFTLWAGQVYLDDTERKTFQDTEQQLLMKTVHHYSTCSSDMGTQMTNGVANLHNLSFNFPIVDLVWVIADPGRRAKYTTTTQGQYSQNQGLIGALAPGKSTPYLSGVRSLYGQMAGGHKALTLGKPDWNVIRSGSTVIDTLQVNATTSAQVPLDIVSSAGVKEWRNDGLNGCLHLPGNRFDYRMAGDVTVSGVDGDTIAPNVSAVVETAELEPMESFKLTFESADRVDPNLRPEYYRTVQPLEHFNNIPRKGIYAYSFAMNASSPFPNGTCNFSRINQKDLCITKNREHTTQVNRAGDGKDSGAEVYLWAEHFQVFVINKNTMGKLFGT